MEWCEQRLLASHSQSHMSISVLLVVDGPLRRAISIFTAFFCVCLEVAVFRNESAMSEGSLPAHTNPLFSPSQLIVLSGVKIPEEL